MATQVVKMNKSILNYFKMVMNFDNESEEYRKITEKEFIEELTNSLNCDLATKEIVWVEDEYKKEYKRWRRQIGLGFKR